MLFSIKQSILAEETLANLWSFAKSANVSTLQSFSPYTVLVSIQLIWPDKFEFLIHKPVSGPILILSTATLCPTYNGPR